MIEKALKRLGVKKCGSCGSLVDRDADNCEKCGHGFPRTSTPEDGL